MSLSKPTQNGPGNSQRGVFTINELSPGMTLEEASEVVGPLFLSVRDKRNPQYPVQYVTESLPGLWVYLNKGSTVIDDIRGFSIERDKISVLKLGASSTTVEKILGLPEAKIGWARQFWSYHNVGITGISLSLMLDEGVLSGISTITGGRTR